MERAQREADGPRRRILEAAKLKGTVKSAEPSSPTVNAVPAAATPAAAAAAPKDEPPPERMLVTPSGAIAPVALPASGVSQVPLASKVEVAPAAAALVALPQVPKIDLSEPPRLLSKVEPDLPTRFLRRLGNRRSEVTADLTIEADGSVSAVGVRAPADDDLVEPVRQALTQWRYEPQPQRRTHAVRLVFSAQAN